MKVRKTMVLKIVIPVVIAVVVGYALNVFYFLVDWDDAFWSVAAKWVDKRRVRLLCKTDHQALLEACNELSKQVAEGNLKPGTYNVRRDRHPKVSQFPQPILDLAPSYVYIDENDSNRVMLEMLGGLGHFGVEAYTEDYQKPPFAGFKFGDKELIPGLWYYDDGYRGHPEYEKRIEALMQKRK